MLFVDSASSVRRWRHWALVLAAWVLAPSVLSAADFIHPGLLHGREDLARMKSAVAAKQEPVFSGFEVLRSNSASQAAYRLKGPFGEIGRNPNVHFPDYDSDANAAYQCALMWCITGEPAYADKSKEILNAWCSTLKKVSGRDAVLMAGLGPFKMVNAAELLRSTDSGWEDGEVRRAQQHFREVIYPVLKDFAPFANGNWDTAAMKTTMAIGVFCDDRAMFERALCYYIAGSGDGALTHYIINSAGQCQESGRDQQHTQLGLAHLGDCCEIAWHQGLDLYSYDDNRLLKGFEYTARYNLGKDVPFVETLDQTGKYHHFMISTNGRGRLRPVFEEIYNHYAKRAGIPVVNTQCAASQMRPEGAVGSGADHPGFGTLLFFRNSTAPQTNASAPAAPAGIAGSASAEAIKLCWVPPVGAKSYLVKRAKGDRAPEIIARNLTATTYRDANVKAGESYSYTIIAANSAGRSAESRPLAIYAGLPSPWKEYNVGSNPAAGSATAVGNYFILEATGEMIGGTNEQFGFASAPLAGDGAVIARYVPQVSSQFTRFGLTMREATSPGAPAVSLLLEPGAGESIEAPSWKARWSARERSGVSPAAPDSEQGLSAPAITHGRLTGPVWLKLERCGNQFTALISTNGSAWIAIGASTMPLKRSLLAGLVVCSGIKERATVVTFDHVAINKETGTPCSNGEARVDSPDGNVEVSFLAESNGVPAYRVNYLGRPLVLPSRLGLLPGLTDGFAVESISRSLHQGEWSPVCSERKTIPDNYRELNVDLVRATGQRLRLTFRAYNEGAAFRYSFPPSTGSPIQLNGERSEFRFSEDTFSYEEYGTEGEYRRVRVADIRSECERPLTLEFADGRFASLGEADDENYPRMLLSPAPEPSGALISALGGTTANTSRRSGTNDPSARLHPGDSTPWRFFVVGERPGDLLERNSLLLNLNPPCALQDTSWIKPGKAMRDIELTTTNSEAIIDFAEKAGLQYVELDWHWYGQDETFETGDATTVRAPNLDLPRVIRSAGQKGLGVILYVDRRLMKKQRDVLFPLYEKWGVKGVKIGFVDVGPQSETAWIAETVRQAALHHLTLDIHDGYRSMGLSRTYPNLLTVEGIRGNEHMPSCEHNCTLPFTRFVAGCGDYTVCYYTKRKQTTCSHQLAMAVVAFSPLQSLFWYDRPSDYRGEPEIEFFRHVPTVWDETRVLDGEIGKYAAIARRAGKEWFVGVINGRQPRELRIRLGFLEPTARYIAHLYSDDDTVATRTKVAVATREVSAQTVLDEPLKAAGGLALWIAP